MIWDVTDKDGKLTKIDAASRSGAKVMAAQLGLPAPYTAYPGSGEGIQAVYSTDYHSDKILDLTKCKCGKESNGEFDSRFPTYTPCLDHHHLSPVEYSNMEIKNDQ